MSEISLLNQIQDYTSPYCYQYKKRLDTLEEDKIKLGFTDDDLKNIKLDDFEFSIITTEDGKEKARNFIKRYEWLGTIGAFPTHWFQAKYHGLLGGVVIMAMPNSFSKILGENTKNVERLISRGASASWTPFNLGSKFLMWCMKWMVNNTQYRLFTCYSDPQAKEKGSIYQALNFYYLGNNNGTTIRCINPYNETKIISDRTFRARSFYKRYAKDLGIEWKKEWNSDQIVHWDLIPNDIEQKLREYAKEMYKKSKKVVFPSKHKYAYVLGKDKRETKKLRKLFLSINKIKAYPKQR